jgi:diguanylate cyclase (GGDEF)-like protein
VITGIEVPLELAALLCAASLAAGTLAGRARTNRRRERRLSDRNDPLAPLLRPEVLAGAIDMATRRNAARASSRAVLHGRIDQFSAHANNWSGETRREVREHVAAVMRAGLRRDDRIAVVEGDGFTIDVRGADERAAVRIANRLRHTLAQLHFPHLEGVSALTASFGVAAARFGEGDSGLGHRARQALDAAAMRGADIVVPASEIEEIMLLPAPSPSSSAA